MKKDQILQYIGNLSQIGFCRHYTLNEGWGRVMRATDVVTGGGLQYTVLPDRGMDISLAIYKGINLVYLTCNGETHPSFFEPEGLGWLRTFAAGLLTTCGLTYLGPPCQDEGQDLGLHGRISTTPARQFSDLSGWEGDTYRYTLKGVMEEGRIFGYKLRLEREITSYNSQNTILLTDTITNFGNKPSPYTILYHFNFGYPLLSEDAEMLIKSLQTVPRDNDAVPGMSDFNSFIKPQPVYHEQVFFHTMRGNDQGDTTVVLQNKKMGIAVSLTFNVHQLPYVTQWKTMAYGEYALGIEPCNVLCKSRKDLRDENALPVLQPGESITNKIEIRVVDIQ
jgi:galactose mutarotase-like enzyme